MSEQWKSSVNRSVYHLCSTAMPSKQRVLLLEEYAEGEYKSSTSMVKVRTIRTETGNLSSNLFHAQQKYDPTSLYHLQAMHETMEHTPV